MKLSLLVFFIVSIFTSCEEKVKPPVTGAFDARSLPTQESWKSSVVFSDSGRVRAKLTSGHIAMFEQRRETLLDSNIQIDFYNADGSHSSVLTARRGRVDDATQNMEAFDDVVVISDSGTVVKTEYLFWDQRMKKVRSDKFVTVKSPKETLQGYGFEADQGLQNYTIYRVSGSAVVELKKDSAASKMQVPEEN
jgi:LPS export ABC transporter protein LptC